MSETTQTTETSPAAESTAVTKPEEQKLNVGARNGLEMLSPDGRAAVEKKRELTTMAKMFEGMEWGSVKGSALSNHTRYALAEFCYLTRANPQLHVFILGGRPYLNADYYADLCNSDPHFIRYEQLNVTPGMGAKLRNVAEQALKDAAMLTEAGATEEAETARAHAGKLLSDARYSDAAIIQYGVPHDALSAYETRIYRYVNGAPLDRIMAGEIDPEPYIKVAPECNWVVNDPKDPIGKGDPDTTARTRSFRRCARFAFPTWMEQREEEIKRAEKAIEADWRIVESDERQVRATLPGPNGEQAVRASGEPEARNAAGAQDLPTYGAEPVQQGQEPTASASSWDATDTRKRFFATLRDAGVATEDRKAWQEAHGLPESTSEWGQAEYSRALDLLLAPTMEAVRQGAEAMGIDDLDLFVSDKLGRPADTLRDWKQVLSHLNALADAPNGQTSLV